MLTDEETTTEAGARPDGTAAPRPRWVHSLEQRTGLFATADARTCVLVAVTGVAAFLALGALEPTAAHPELEHSIWFALLSTAFWAAAFAAGVGLVQRQRFGLVAAAYAAAIQLGAVVMCPVSGHHAYGPWWLAQMSIAIAFCAVTASAVGWSRAR